MKDTSIKKGMIYHELNKVLPCRVGIEFELSGNFNKGFFSDHPDLVVDEELTNEHENTAIRDYYNLKDFSSDLSSSDAFNDDNLYEVRVSIDKYKQLSSLYKILSDISKYCNYHQNGGIHIHVDMNQYLSPNRSTETELKELMSRYISKRLDEITRIFPKYTGKYNKKEVGIVRKKTYVNISRLGTLEFRIAPLTFDYTTLITWISGLMRFRRKLITELRLVENHTSVAENYTLVESQEPPVSLNENQYYELGSCSSGTLPSSNYTDRALGDRNLYLSRWSYYDASSYPGNSNTLL